MPNTNNERRLGTSQMSNIIISTVLKKWYLLYALFQDILFGLVRKLFHNRREGSDDTYKPVNHLPKIVIMSATLNHEKFSEFLGGCPVFKIPGRCFPVESVFLNYVGVKDLQTPNYLKRVSLWLLI